MTIYKQAAKTAMVKERQPHKEKYLRLELNECRPFILLLRTSQKLKNIETVVAKITSI